MIATDYATYEEYCVANAHKGLQVIPESLWKVLKEAV